MLWTVGCDHSEQRSASGPADEITYPIPAEGLSVRRALEDATRILGRKIIGTECVLAESRPIRIAGLPRAPTADALRLFQAIFLTLQLSLVEYGGGPGLILESLDINSIPIRWGRYVWVDDVGSESGDAMINTVILTKHVPGSEIRDAVISLHDPRSSWFIELGELRGWIVRESPATIVKMLAVVRTMDVPPGESRPVGPTSR